MCRWIEGHLYLHLKCGEDLTLLYFSVFSYRNETSLTENFACLVRLWLLCLWRCDIAGCSLLFSDRWCLVFTFFCHCWPPQVFCVLAVSPLFPLISCCLAFAIFLISLTLALFLLGGFFYRSHSWIFAVCRSSTTFLDVFSCPPHWFLLWFGRDKQRGWWAWIDGACIGDKIKERKNALWEILF